MQLGVVFWFYKDAVVCENRLRLLRRRNAGLPVYGLYGGPPEEAPEFARRLGTRLDDFWCYPDPVDAEWKWRNGDLMLARWFAERGTAFAWDSVFVAQWDMVVTRPIAELLPPMEKGEMLLSGLRPVREVESWWRWTRWKATRREYDELLALVAERYGAVDDPWCCQFIGMVLPRGFLERYGGIERPELGFLEYKVPVYAQAFGVPLVADTVFRPWWPEEPGAGQSPRTDRLVHAWGTPVRLPVMLYEATRPRGRRVFHPYHGIYPHDISSVRDALRHRRAGRLAAAAS